jgi:hypothetical protein
MQPAEKPQLDDLGLPRMQFGQAVQGLVQHEQVAVALWQGRQIVVQLQAFPSAAALLAPPRTDVVNEHVPDGLGRGGEEMCPVPPFHLVLADEPQIGLVHQGGGLERQGARLAAQVALGQGAELVVDERQQAVYGRGIAAAGTLQNLRDVHLFQAHTPESAGEKNKSALQPFGSIVVFLYGGCKTFPAGSGVRRRADTLRQGLSEPGHEATRPRSASGCCLVIDALEEKNVSIKHLTVVVAVVALGLAPRVLMAQTPLGSAFTYQGHLTEDGTPINDPALNMRFRLFDAASGGAQVGSDYTPFGGVEVVDGLFTVEPDFGFTPFSGDGRWVEIAVYKLGVGYVTLAPRQRISATPYALYALNGGGGGTSLWSQSGTDIYYTSGEVGVGTAAPGYPLHVSAAAGRAIYAENTAATGHAYGLYARATSTSGEAVYAEATAATGTTYGVEAYAQSPTGYALYGFNEAESGSGIAVRGDCASPDGIAVYGYSANDSGEGTTIGVEGRIDNPSGSAVYGVATASSGTANGVFGETGSTEGSGVFGQNTSTTGDNEGVMGVAWSPSGKGVSGYNGATTGNAIGVLGKTNSTTGYGVYGEASRGSGTSYAVYGRTYSPSGYAGYFAGGKNYFEGAVGVGVTPATDPKLDVATSAFTAIRATTSNTSGRGVWGYASAPSGPAYGVYGVSASPNGAGVCGESGTSGCPAVMGLATSGSGEGGWFESQNGDALHAETDAAGKAALHASIRDSAYGLVVDQTDGYNLEPAIQINASGHTTGIDVNLQNGVSRLAEFTLDDGDFTDSAFLVEADTAGPVAEFIGTNAANPDDMLIARNGGTGAAFYADHTRTANDAPAIYGKHAVSDYYGVGVKGEGGYRGVEGRCVGSGSSTYTGMYAYAAGGSGTCRALYAQAGGGGTNYGVYATASGGTNNYAAYFSGNVHVTGTLSKGGGSFMIDHPLDPANKYLYHSFVESPDMMNIYNGNVVLDAKGEAVVTLPDWFGALNRDFRYQLTCIGGFAQVYIAEEIANNKFKIAGGTPGLKVSWQVTGVRQDAFANTHRIRVEVDKPEDERGTYLYPEAFGLPAELQVDRVHEAADERASLTATGVGR